MQPLDPKVAQALQEQFTKERQNEAVYRDMALGFIFAGLDGFAKWAGKAASEEQEHAANFADYLTDKRGRRAILEALELVSNAPIVPLPAFQEVAALEAENTEAILDLYALCESAEDAQTCEFLREFVGEQTNSEAEIKNHIARLTMIANDGAGILAYNAQLLEG